MREKTWFATIVCILAVIPGFIIGALFKALMYVFGGWAEGSDFLYLHAIFGLETPSAVYHWIFGEAIPNGVQGIVAGYVAVWIMEKIAKGANYSSAAMITGALYMGFLICLVAITLPKLGVTSGLLLGIIQIVGIWIGLASAAATLPAPRRVSV
jgi:hypothetical protein